MYSMDRGTYTCDFCGFEMEWDGHDQTHGDMWGCEKCDRSFCSKCFKDSHGEGGFQKMLQGGGRVLCPDCWKEAMENEKDR